MTDHAIVLRALAEAARQSWSLDPMPGDHLRECVAEGKSAIDRMRDDGNERAIGASIDEWRAARELLREWYSARKAYRREPAAAGWLGQCEEQLEDMASKWMPESTGLDEK